MTDLHDALVQLALAVISVATLAVTMVLLPYLRAKYGTERVSATTHWAERAVKAGEQILGASAETNADKWLYADGFLEKHFPHLSEDQREALIEAAVHDLHSISVSVDAPSVPTETAVATQPVKASKPATRRRGPGGRFAKGGA
jgi:hypothetical protein